MTEFRKLFEQNRMIVETSWRQLSQNTPEQLQYFSEEISLLQVVCNYLQTRSIGNMLSDDIKRNGIYFIV